MAEKSCERSRGGSDGRTLTGKAGCRRCRPRRPRRCRSPARRDRPSPHPHPYRPEADHHRTRNRQSTRKQRAQEHTFPYQKAPKITEKTQKQNSHVFGTIGWGAESRPPGWGDCVPHAARRGHPRKKKALARSLFGLGQCFAYSDSFKQIEQGLVVSVGHGNGHVISEIALRDREPDEKLFSCVGL